MGLFDTAFKWLVDPGDLLGTESAKRAADYAERMGEKSFGLQQDFFNFMKEQQEPFTESALRALPMQEALIGMSGNEAQQEQINQIMSGPFYQSMIDQGEEAIMRNAAATGGLRAGGTQQALARNSQDILNSLVRQKLGDLGNISGRGGQAASNLSQQGLQSIDSMTNTLGSLASSQQAAAAQQQNTGLGILGAVASFFSDRRLKENVEKIGEHNGHNVYKWKWNREAFDVGLSGVGFGVMADEVERVRPELISESKGYKQVDYTRL